MKRYPLIGSQAGEIAGRLRILKRDGSAGYQEAVARQLAPLAGGSDSFAVRFWMRDRAPAYRRELEQFRGELAGGPRSLLEDF
jgi:hypothetical protein